MKFLSSVESWNVFFEWASVILVALTVVAGAGTVITSRIVNKRQSQTILDLQKAASDAKSAQQKVGIDLATARTKQAEAEKSLLALQNLVTSPRKLDAETMGEVLKKGPKGSVEVSYVSGTSEAHMLAVELTGILRDSGWKVPWPKITLNEDAGNEHVMFSIPKGILLKVELKGVPLDKYDPTDPLPEPAETLRKALYSSPEDAGRINCSVNMQPDCKSTSLAIVVGPKY